MSNQPNKRSRRAHSRGSHNPFVRAALTASVLVAVALAAAGAQPIVTASASDGGHDAGSPSGRGTGGPNPDWHLYHRWMDPAWPGAEGAPRADGPPPAYTWPPVPDPWPTPLDTSAPAPGGPPFGEAPGVPPGAPPRDAPHPNPTGSGQDTSPPGGEPDPGTAQTPTPAPSREPVVAGPGTPTLGLGDPVTDPPSTASAMPTAPTPPGSNQNRVLDRDASDTDGYRRSLIYSGLLGLALAVVGITMVTKRRRRW